MYRSCSQARSYVPVKVVQGGNI